MVLKSPLQIFNGLWGDHHHWMFFGGLTIAINDFSMFFFIFLPLLSMVFDGSGPLVERCDGFDGLSWSRCYLHLWCRFFVETPFQVEIVSITALNLARMELELDLHLQQVSIPSETPEPNTQTNTKSQFNQILRNGRTIDASSGFFQGKRRQSPFKEWDCKIGCSGWLWIRLDYLSIPEKCNLEYGFVENSFAF